MFIGWIRKNSLKEDLKKFGEEVLLDENLLVNTINEDQSLCFGAYEDKELQGLITAFRFENSVLINNLYYKKDIDWEIIQRLLKILLDNLQEDEDSILFMANKAEKAVFEKFGFQTYSRFKKAVHSGAAIPFNFSSATAKSISNPAYLSTIKKLDHDAFKEERYDYITETCSKTSSLVLSTKFGFQHSYAINKNHIKISPWIMVDEAFTDAEKLIRGVLYHRGLKTLIAVIPSNVKEIRDLYESYKFQMRDNLFLLYLNKKPDINLESVYGF